MFQLDMPLAIVLVPIIGIAGYYIQAYSMKKKDLAIKREEIKQGLFSAMVDEIPFVFISI